MSGQYDSDIHFRLSLSAKQHIHNQSKLCGISESDYIRKLIDNDMGKNVKMQTKEEFLAHIKLVNEINHIGVNINQIVKNNNSGFYSDADKKDLVVLLDQIYAALDESWRK